MRLVHEDCINVLRELESNSIDSMVTDPPAGISFMNKSWDSGKNFIPFMTEIMSECVGILKPGAHAFVWALPRTSHRTATALENSGFEIRDVVTHLFGSGFPKSLNLGNGWGTNLKPASEHWILCRKPISEKTIAQNVMKWGTGGINIDESKIECYSPRKHIIPKANPSHGIYGNGLNGSKQIGETNNGRFPANIILDEEAAELLDEQSGILKSGAFLAHHKRNVKKYSGNSLHESKTENTSTCMGSEGGASRFFYCAKASQSERNAGIEDGKNIHPTVKSQKLMAYLITMITPPNGIVLDPFMGSGSTGIAALKAGFDFIGIEKEKEYFDIAEKRIMNAS